MRHRPIKPDDRVRCAIAGHAIDSEVFVAYGEMGRVLSVNRAGREATVKFDLKPEPHRVPLAHLRPA